MKIELKNPKDVRAYIEDILKQISDQGSEAENADKVASLLTAWLKAWDSEEVRKIEKRLFVLEKAYQEREKAFMDETEGLMAEVQSDMK